MAFIKKKIFLTSSKSISNRLLIIQALCNEKFEIENLSESQDTIILKKVLSQLRKHQTKEILKLDVGDAGTSFRFLTAFLSQNQGEFILTGSDRMKERPIFPLVETLRNLGAKIDYLEKEKYPPLKIIGQKLESKKVYINANISSQFISALLLIAPNLPNGLHLILNKEIVSSPYIDLTLSLLKEFGIILKKNKNEIILKKQQFKAKNFFVESDWSSASYLYEIVSLAKNIEIELFGLQKNSKQGDKIIYKIFEKIGVISFFKKNSVLLKKNIFFKKPDYFKINASDFPDLVPTIVVTLCLHEIPFEISGLSTLKIKESNRILSLKTELAKFSFHLEEEKNTLIFRKENFYKNKNKKIHIETYKDHRIALAFAPAIFKNYELSFSDKKVVNKSYPNFWEDLNDLFALNCLINK